MDLFNLAGKDAAYKYVVQNVVVADKTLSIDLSSTIDNATISGFAIYSSNGGTYEEPAEPVCTTAERHDTHTN